jgi:hypothetical protein
VFSLTASLILPNLKINTTAAAPAKKKRGMANSANGADRRISPGDDFDVSLGLSKKQLP